MNLISKLKNKLNEKHLSYLYRLSIKHYMDINKHLEELNNCLNGYDYLVENNQLITNSLFQEIMVNLQTVDYYKTEIFKNFYVFLTSSYKTDYEQQKYEELIETLDSKFQQIINDFKEKDYKDISSTTIKYEMLRTLNVHPARFDEEIQKLKSKETTETKTLEQ